MIVHFFKISIFWVVRGGRESKRAKKVQNDNNFCLLHSISQEPYIIWLSFMLHICKIIISPGIWFHFSKILSFWVVRGVKGQNMVQNDKKSCPSLAPYLRNHIIHHMSLIYGTHVGDATSMRDSNVTHTLRVWSNFAQIFLLIRNKSEQNFFT